jgi:transcriptional regulator with XRE-family HTH domain
MNERIKKLRGVLKISQEKFGARIKISGASVSKIESGENNPSEQTLSLIISEFNVNESWLRDGVGEMFKAPSSEAERLVKKYSFPDIVGKLLTVYEGLEQHQQEAVLEYAQRVITSMIDDDSIEAKVAAYREELLSEKNSGTSSASRNGKDTGIETA